MTASAKISIRLFDKADIPFALEQTAREGWDTTREFLEALLAHDRNGAFIGNFGEQPAGMITTTRFNGSAWVGNLIVRPEFRNYSVGSQLMKHALQNIDRSRIETVRLEADPLGVNIYRRLGFRAEFDSPRFRIERYRFTPPSHVQRLSANDLSEITEIDREAFGDSRLRLLTFLFRNVAAAYQIKKEGSLTGYLFVQYSSGGFRLGPWIAQNSEIARDLMIAALSGTYPRPVIVAVPGANSAAIHLLQSHGFYQTPSSLRMVRGAKSAVGLPQNIYGLASGAIG